MMMDQLRISEHNLAVIFEKHSSMTKCVYCCKKSVNVLLKKQSSKQIFDFDVGVDLYVDRQLFEDVRILMEKQSSEQNFGFENSFIRAEF
jgi:hypothetical protein